MSQDNCEADPLTKFIYEHHVLKIHPSTIGPGGTGRTMGNMDQFWALCAYIVIVWSYKPGETIPSIPIFNVYTRDIHFVCYLDRRNLLHESTPICEITDISAGSLPECCLLEGLIKLLKTCGHIVTSAYKESLCIVTIDKLQRAESNLLRKALRYVDYMYIPRHIVAFPHTRLGDESFSYLPKVNTSHVKWRLNLA